MKPILSAMIALASFGPADAGMPANGSDDPLVRALSANAVEVPVELAAFAPAQDALPADAEFSGRLLAPAGSDGRATIHTDSLNLAALPGYVPALPDIDVTLVQTEGALLPLELESQGVEHPAWELIFAPGHVWKTKHDGDWNRAALPFTLRERNADCMHYGVLAFRFNARGEHSELVYQIVSQTCAYYQFTLAGRRPIELRPATVPDAATAIADWQQERESRPPLRAIESLASDYPGAQPERFASSAEVPPESLTTWGFVIDGIHYAGDCPTRFGAYPYCDEIALPSYSLAKSLFAGLAVARAELLYPGISQESIARWVPECADVEAWQGVTIAHAMDMATGNFASAQTDADENAMITSPFFIADDHASKARVACTAFERNAPPGTTFVYHTSDMYLAGAALAAALRARAGEKFDLYSSLIVDPLWRPLGLSRLSHTTRRSNDSTEQPFFAWGLAFQRADLVRIAAFLLDGGIEIDGQPILDADLMAASLQRDPQDRGLDADIPGMKYRNGFRGLDVAPYLGCAQPTWVSLLSGYGGIVLILMPNNTAYYYVSDGYAFRWLDAARASHRIRPFCETESNRNQQ